METLARHFDTAIETPDGIKKLRELILSLAMKGKLVPQNPKDQPASELLKEIEKEKERLVKEGNTSASLSARIKKQDALPAIKPEEIPYELPKGWEWIKLGECTLITMGQSPDSRYYNEKGDGIPFFQGKSEYGVLYPTPRKWCTRPEKIAQENDILISVRAPVGPTNICKTESCIGRGLSAISMLGKSEVFYFLYFFRAFEKHIASFGTGSTFSAITLKVLQNLLVPLPPLAEQKRIVEKIDQLMSLCNKLEAERNARDNKRISVHTAAANRLLGATDKPAFDKSWSFITKNFNELYSVTENVAELKKAILQLAVMGKLVPQDRKDQPAIELLKEIEKEKAKLVKEGRIKKQEALPPIKPEEIPYQLPEGWVWVRLGEILNVKGGKRLPKGFQLTKIPTKNIYIRVTDMKNGTIDDSDLHYVPDAAYNSIKQYIIEKDDLYLTIVGATIGKLGLVPDKFHQMILTENAARLMLLLVDKKFLYYSLISDFIQKQFIGNTKQVGVPKLALYRVTNTMFPLPPLAEQKRIVAKIDQLMELCNSLEQGIKDSTEKRSRVLGAVLARV